jgi:hypothetical protein
MEAAEDGRAPTEELRGYNLGASVRRVMQSRCTNIHQQPRQLPYGS